MKKLSDLSTSDPLLLSPPQTPNTTMAFSSATALKGATVAAIFVVVAMSSVGKPAAAARASCRERYIAACISECPSKCQAKAGDQCGGLKHGGSPQCPLNCLMACTGSCESSCNSGRACPSGGAEACDPTCRTTCDKDCYDRESPSYQPCLSGVFQGCKDSCEADCKDGN